MPHEISRRGLIAGSLAAAGLSAIGLPLLASSRAEAAIAWFYPFTRYFNPGARFNDYDPQTWTDTGYHHAFDIEAPADEPVRACASGTVVESYYNTANLLGWVVRIDHGENRSTLYAHMRQQSDLPVGTVVPASAVIGYVGNTGGIGFTYPFHLHVEVWAPTRGSRIDPEPLINYPNAPLAGTVTNVPSGSVIRREDVATGFLRDPNGSIYIVNSETGKLRGLSYVEWVSYSAQGYAVGNVSTAEIQALIAANGTSTVSP